MSLDNLKTKPKDTRKKILFWCIFLIMTGIIGGWIYFMSNTERTKVSQPNFMDNIKFFGNVVNESVDGIQDSTGEYKENRSLQIEE
jgi:hypothetical protein